jgi:hypothetical protein
VTSHQKECIDPVDPPTLTNATMTTTRKKTQPSTVTTTTVASNAIACGRAVPLVNDHNLSLGRGTKSKARWSLTETVRVPLRTLTLTFDLSNLNLEYWWNVVIRRVSLRTSCRR